MRWYRLFMVMAVIGCVFVLFYREGWIVAPRTEQAPVAFEGALGYGRFTSGGSGGKVYEVTTLEDNRQPGSLRHALLQDHPRIVRFQVSGIIFLKKPLKIDAGNLTVEGQTSPAGVVIAGAPVAIAADQVILRYLRFRLGTFGYVGDTLEAQNTRNVIVDHCSLSWSVDETASFYNNTDFTLQNSIISHSLNSAIHPKGEHGYGGIWGGRRASFINNIVANHHGRTPRVNGHRLSPDYPESEELVEILNNVIFNWGDSSVYGAENGRLDLVNNFYLPGADTKKARFFDLYPGRSKVFLSGNDYFGKPGWLSNNLLGVVVRSEEPNSEALQASTQLSRFAASPAGAHTKYVVPARRAYEAIVEGKRAGANRNAKGFFLDSVDSNIYTHIESTLAGNPESGIIDGEFELIESWDDYASEFKERP